MSKNNGGFLFGAIIGGVVGAATAMFLTSEKGKKLIAELNENDNLEPIKTKATEWLSIAKEKTKEVAKFTSPTKESPQMNSIPEENEQIAQEAASIPLPINNNKETIEKLLKEAEAALNDAEQKRHSGETE
ncbi:YtxH domain-containing protein [Anoxybacteroides tepidamans]|uniref:YtxH domain-containing protein n=1 Tax=Anoxybacteroides tepidamans TaxID=265948 RepID=UPI0004883D04|nr:YtxH domain-containing protein [Anoxybacillus tepidamans]